MSFREFCKIRGLPQDGNSAVSYQRWVDSLPIYREDELRFIGEKGNTEDTVWMIGLYFVIIVALFYAAC